ncbi:MAG: hypothetical protein ACJ749_03785 [Flavisolibacter sp.]|jgi:hypothetical protein
MSANAIDNSNLKNYRDDRGTTDFVPGLTYAWDQEAEEIDFTDASTFPSGVALKKIHLHVHDKFGGEAVGYIYPNSGSDSGHDHNTTVDVSDLDASKGLDVKATVIGDDNMLVADGGAYNIAASGSLGSWDAQKNADPEAGV